jgi:hypothetical protein
VGLSGGTALLGLRPFGEAHPNTHEWD